MFINLLLALVILSFIINITRHIDENNMDDYDRYFGIADDGRTRGMFGTIYKNDGSVDILMNLYDMNPFWNL
jgi:hypothetical protein